MTALSPCRIGKCEIRNRFVMTAANLGWCTDGFVTDRVVAFYRERARGEAGLLIAGAAGVDPKRVNTAGMMQIYDDKFIEPMRSLTDAVHEEGGKIFLQLMHAGAYARSDEHAGVKAVAPSAYRCRFSGEETEALTTAQIKEIIADFQAAALRAKKAGLDGVELIGSAGYLIAEFLSQATNHRTDAYGGSIENRARFLLEIIAAVREAVGEDFPVIVRLSGTDFVEGGNGPEEFLTIGRLIAEKVDAIDVTGGWHESGVPQITSNVPQGMYLYLAKALKESVTCPVIGCNRLDAQTAAAAVDAGYMDMAGMLRAWIAEPHLAKKYRERREGEIRPCLACNQGCLDLVFSGKEVRCAVNPLVGREGLCEPIPSKKEPEKILVLGAGIAGMVFALLAAKENEVVIWERDFEPGGQARAIEKLPNRAAVGDYAAYLYRQCLLKKIPICWNREVSDEEVHALLEEKTFDYIVDARGAVQAPLSYPVSEGAKIWEASDFMRRGKPFAQNARHIVILGGSYKAVQAAFFGKAAQKSGQEKRDFLAHYDAESLAFANNMMGWDERSVTILTSDKRAGSGFGKSTRFVMLREIKEKGITVKKEAEIRKIAEDRILYLEGGSERYIPADLVIDARGYQARSKAPPQSEDTAKKILTIGDARRPGRISEAVEDAFRAAITLKEGNDV